MRRVFNSRFVAPVVGLAILAVYWPVAWSMDDTMQVELLRVTQATILAVLFTLFVRSLGRAFRPDVTDGTRRFYLGLTLWAAAASTGGLFRGVYYMAGGGPDLAWMLTSDGASFLLWMEIVGGLFVLSGPAVRGGNTPKEQPETSGISWARVALTLALCAATTCAALVLGHNSCSLRSALTTVETWMP